MSSQPPTHRDSRVTAGVAPDASAAAPASASSSPEPPKEQQPTQPQSPSPARRSLLRRNVGDDDHGRGVEGEGVEEVKAVAITADHKPDVPAEQVGGHLVSVGACVVGWWGGVGCFFRACLSPLSRPTHLKHQHNHSIQHNTHKARIVAAGGRVFAVSYDDGVDGPSRVWLGHMDIPGLAMSRSLGDAVAHTAGGCLCGLGCCVCVCGCLL